MDRDNRHTGRMTVSLQQLLQQMATVRQQALKFQEWNTSVVDGPPSLWVEIVDELNVTLEKLQVAEEDLIQQNEELAEACQEAEERLAEVQQLAQLGHWGWHVSDNVVSWSDEMYRIYGLEPQSRLITYEEFLQRVYPADRVQVSHVVETARQLGQPFTFEHRIVRADGAIRILQARGQAVVDQWGQVVRLLGTGQDVTERKEVEEQVRQLNVELERRVATRTGELSRVNVELRESEERFRVMANLAPTMVWTADPDGKLTYANQQWLDYCGVSSEEAAVGWPELCLHPEDAAYYLRQWQHALDEGHECEVEVRNRRYDGEYRWFLTRAVPTRDAAGQITAWIGTTTDIHDHRVTEEAIRQLNQELDRRVEELETLLNVLPVGIAVAHDPECREITVNPACARLLGISQEENPSKSRPDPDVLPFKVLRNGQEVPASELPLQYASAHGLELRDVELDLARADGKQLNLLEYASPLYDEYDRVRGCLGVMVDVTPFKVVERRLALQYAVAHALAESIGVSEASAKVLQAVCEITGSEFGALWRIDPATGQLRNESTWQAPTLKVDGFAGMTRSLQFQLDQGLPGRVFTSGRPVWIADMATAGLPRSHAAQSNDLHSAFAVPIRSEGEVTGVMECFGRTIREPEFDLIEQLDAIGYQVGLFMERKQVEDDLAMRVHQQAIVAEVGQRALSGLPLQDLLDEVAGHVALTLSVGFCGILELQSNPDRLVKRAGIGWKDLTDPLIVSSGLDSTAGYTLATNEPLIFNHLKSDSRFTASHVLHEHHIVSGLSVKIPGKERPYGVLGAYSTKPRLFSEDDVHFLQAVAHVVALAVERWQAEAALQLSRTEIAIILDSMSDGISAVNQEGQRTYANQALVRLLRFDSMQEMLALSTTEYPQRFDVLDEAGRPLAPDLFPAPRALHGQPTPGLVVRYKFHTTGEEMWAVLKSQPVYNEAGEVVMAVNMLQDISHLKRAELAQRLLAETGALLTKALDYKTRLDELARLVVPRLADWCAIDLLDEQGVLQRVSVVHVDPDKAKWAWELWQRFPPNPASRTGSYEVVRTGQPQLLPKITPELYDQITDPELLEILQQLDLHSAMTVPLTARGRQLGVITFIWAESGYHYTLADLELAQELARRAALALDNARLYDEAQRLNIELEQRVLQRTGELQTANIQLNAEITERRQAEAQVRSMNTELEGRVLERTRQLEVINHDLQHEITERKQAEKALRLALQRTRELYTLSQHISLARSTEEVLQILLSSSYLKYTARASVAIFDAIWREDENPPAGCTILAAWNRDPETQLYLEQHMSLEEYGLIPPFSRREVLFINDIRNDTRISEVMRQRLLSVHTASSLLFPLIASGEWYGMFSIHFRFVDIVNAEDILHLRGLVDEAAMAIYNFQLLENEAQARREAERANNLKMKFLAMISHELRTPLASIKGFASTLLAGDVVWQPENQQEFIATIDSEADKLVDLIEQLLDLSRLEAGTLRIAPRAEKWERILASAQAQLQALTTQHHFTMQLPPHLPPVKADSRRVAQVITNLVNNAVKYSPPQTSITLSVMPYSASEVKVSISDEGVGIPPEARARVFEAFQQLQQGRSDSSGAGLGLAICRGLIESHGGRIWVDEHEGPGTTLSFTLPLA
ncbi:Alkaline phosphatase synthesis sensor protein PhoR [Thermoflexales bacterium]|nr:Alkaline phosphatase synthesis sensor protein PhoR [Thermoflexales bacterium]